jgi:3-hydroxyisobutyrate dehydrogenase/2-hydroxy-3-oxopropionate reductase
MTTTSPLLSVRIYEEAKKAGVFALDAPVSGGDVGARNATRVIMVGGDQEVFERCRGILACMGSNIVYEGPAGSGQHTKMANQVAISGAIAGVAEALTYAKKVGLDRQKMIDTLLSGAARSGQLQNLGPRILKNDFAPGFYMKHFIKDMTIAAEEAKERELKLPILQEVLSIYEELRDRGYGDLGTQALIKYYDE